MDLHDYKDVAEDYDRYLEVMYSEFDVLLYLAERGIDIDGTDLSEEMCKVAAIGKLVDAYICRDDILS